MQERSNPLILLTGATGYIGGRLLPLLEERGYRVRCLARRPEALSRHAGESTEVVAGDVLDRTALTTASKEVDTTFVFVHSMGSDRDFEYEYRIAGENFAQVAAGAGIRRVVYLRIRCGARRSGSFRATTAPSRIDKIGTVNESARGSA